MAKQKGVKPWSYAYVVLKDKTKIFVEETEEEITEQLGKKEFIRLSIAGPGSETINVRSDNIDYFGRNKI